MNEEQKYEAIYAIDRVVQEIKRVHERQLQQDLIAAMSAYQQWYQLTKRLHGFWVAAAMWAFLNPTSNTLTDTSEEQLAGYQRAKRNYESWQTHKGGSHPKGCICAPCTYLDSLEPASEEVVQLDAYGFPLYE